jgi:hypothetical protein
MRFGYGNLAWCRLLTLRLEGIIVGGRQMIMILQRERKNAHRVKPVRVDEIY